MRLKYLTLSCTSSVQLLEVQLLSVAVINLVECVEDSDD